METGGPGDWLATALYLADQVMFDDESGITVDVFRENPWDHAPPQQFKTLAQVGYSASAEREKRWSMSVAWHMPTVIDIEADILTAKLYDPDLRPHPKRKGETPEAAARRLIIQKYRLPATWQITPNLGRRGVYLQREQIKVMVPSGVDASQLQKCLARPARGITRCE